jgi:hypothetical protein
MSSPFPGMNPYLEQEDAWHDFHQRFAPFVADLLEAQVGPGYIVKVESHIYVHDLPDDERHLLGRADISVARPSPSAGTNSSVAVLEAPAQVWLPVYDIERDSYVEIRDRRGRQLITIIELLSPSNKLPGADRDQYVAKRAQLFSSSAHLVEIDLLRGGERMPMEGLSPCDYCVLVSRAEERRRAGLWPIRLRDPLPTIPIPLRAPDPDARIDLKLALDHIYYSANYAKYIYDGTPNPLLSPEDAEWARRFVAAS